MASSKKTFYAILAAGLAFVGIGIAASIYSGVPVDVPLDGPVRPGSVDVLSPDMNVGSTASISVIGSTFSVDIIDPDRQTIKSEAGVSSFSYDFTAQKAGEHRIIVNNTGSTEALITGHAQTKASPLGFSGPLMLVVTGVILVGVSLRFGGIKKRG